MSQKIHCFLSAILSFFKEQEKKFSPNTAPLLYTLAATIFAYGNALCAKFMVMEYSPFQLTYSVCLVCSLLTQFFRLSNPKLSFSLLKPRELKFILIRGFFSMTAHMMCFYYLTKYLPLSMINVIYGFTPVIVFVLDRVMNSNPLKKTEIFGSFLAFIGIVLVIDIFQWGGEATNHAVFFYESTGFERVKYCFLCLLACFGFAFADISMKELHNLNVLVILFYMYFFEIIIMNLVGISQGANLKFFEIGDLLKIIFFNGMFQFFFMLTFTRALQLGKKGRVVVLNNIQLLYSFIIEIFIFHQTPTLIRILGSVILIGGITRAVL